MAANIRWNPRKRIITLFLSGEYMFDEFKEVNRIIGQICNEPDFDYAYLIVDMDDVSRPKFSTAEARQHTNHFRESNLRMMYVSGLNRAFQFIGNTFRPAIEGAVGTPLLFVGDVDEALADIEKREGHYAGVASA